MSSMAGSTLVSPTASAKARTASRAKRVSPWHETWRRFRRHRLAVAGSIVLGFMILAVIAGPWLWPVSLDDIDFSAMRQGPSLAHPLGCDDLGRDILARLLYGGRISLAVGLAAMAVAIVVGVI